MEGPPIESHEGGEPRLEDPAVQYKESYIAAAQELAERGKWVGPEIATIETDFEGYVRSLNANAQPETLPPGQIPVHMFWFMQGNHFIGDVQVRQFLNESLEKDWRGHIGYSVRPSEWSKGYGTLMLQQGLKKARALGLREVLIVTDESNTASRRIIEKNNGSLLNCTTLEGMEGKVCRYIIKTE